MMFGPDDLIDHDGPITPYRQLAAILKARIARGDWRPNRPIPSEARLVQEYGLARSTVRRGIAELVAEGVLFVMPQRGTYVSPSDSTEGAEG
ncbi:GntR family transcriptional regulator [Nonomuraea glycinis]|nr:GntR family transcriptional regulator [Nonomuraea glycinis]MCA2182808.1 GntR family transcriptional regulator [Nonomuraea glycinis]